MNLLQKAIVRNLENRYKTLKALSEAIERHCKTAGEEYLFIQKYWNYCQKTGEDQIDQERIYGKEFNEEIALRRGSKMFREILKRHIKQLRKYNKKIKNNYEFQSHPLAKGQAKLLLEALNGGQTYSDEQIAKALTGILDAAVDINRLCLDKKGNYNEISNVERYALDIFNNEQTKISA